MSKGVGNTYNIDARIEADSVRKVLVKVLIVWGGGRIMTTQFSNEPTM